MAEYSDVQRKGLLKLCIRNAAAPSRHTRRGSLPVSRRRGRSRCLSVDDRTLRRLDALLRRNPVPLRRLRSRSSVRSEYATSGSIARSRSATTARRTRASRPGPPIPPRFARSRQAPAVSQPARVTVTSPRPFPTVSPETTGCSTPRRTRSSRSFARTRAIRPALPARVRSTLRRAPSTAAELR